MDGSTYRYGMTSRSRKFLLLFVLGVVLALVSAGNAFAYVSPPAVGLGTADSFAVLAHTGVTDTLVPCCSTINGNLGNDGNNPTTGTPTINGTSYVNDGAGVAAGARAALNTAIINASGRTPNLTFGAGDNQLGVAAVLSPGVYSLPDAPTANLVGNLTLSGSATDVWIFQATDKLVTAVGSSITFSGGAQACNVFWVVASSATLNGASFAGTVLASTSVTIGAGVTVDGRTMAYTGDVTLIKDTISRPGCATAPGPTPAAPTPPSAPNRALYCDASGKTYDLVVGEDKLPPYAGLGLVPAYVNPVTGSESCNFPTVTAPTPTPPPTPAPVVVVPTPTPTPTPTPVKPKAKPPVKHAVKGATKVRVLRVAPKPKPARHHSGFTG